MTSRQELRETVGDDSVVNDLLDELDRAEAESAKLRDENEVLLKGLRDFGDGVERGRNQMRHAIVEWLRQQRPARGKSSGALGSVTLLARIANQIAVGQADPVDQHFAPKV